MLLAVSSAEVILTGLSPSLAHGLQAPSDTYSLSPHMWGTQHANSPRSQLPLAFSVWTSMKSRGSPRGGLVISKEEGALFWLQVTHYSLQSNFPAIKLMCLVSLFGSIFLSFFPFNINLFILIGGQLLYNIVLVLPYINMKRHGCTHVPHSEPPSPLPPHTIPLGHPSAPAPSIQYHASNLDWRFISYMMCTCVNAIRPNHPTLTLSQSPKDCSIYLCFFCCLAYRVIVTIFINSIYMH